MTTFQVADMTCGHCISAITQAIKRADADASVNVDLSTHRVDIESAVADAAKLSAVIKDAGYTPVALTHPAPPPAAQQATRSRCCCG
jgi:copper chaperone